MRKVFIAGATSAIAQETARLFATEGAALFLVARNAERLAAVAEDLRVRGAARVEAVAADLNEFDRHPALVEQAAHALGGLDILLVAHGILGDQKVCEVDFARARQVIDTNFTGVVSLLTPAAAFFEQQKSGCIVVLGSVAGDRGRQSNYVYGSSKAALDVFLQGLRNRLYPAGVRVVTVKPGFVDTPMTAQIQKNALFAHPATVARGIWTAIAKGKDITYLPAFWWPIMIAVRHLPEVIAKRFKW